jgi:hypothetical protein
MVPYSSTGLLLLWYLTVHQDYFSYGTLQSTMTTSGMVPEVHQDYFCYGTLQSTSTTSVMVPYSPPGLFLRCPSDLQSFSYFTPKLNSTIIMQQNNLQLCPPTGDVMNQTRCVYCSCVHRQKHNSPSTCLL